MAVISIVVVALIIIVTDIFAVLNNSPVALISFIGHARSIDDGWVNNGDWLGYWLVDLLTTFTAVISWIVDLRSSKLEELFFDFSILAVSLSKD